MLFSSGMCDIPIWNQQPLTIKVFYCVNYKVYEVGQWKFWLSMKQTNHSNWDLKQKKKKVFEKCKEQMYKMFFILWGNVLLSNEACN